MLKPEIFGCKISSLCLKPMEIKITLFSIFIAILGMHNLITNAQLCNIVGSSNGVDQEHFSSEYLYCIVNLNPLLNVLYFVFSMYQIQYIYTPDVLYKYLKPKIPVRWY